jgi:hypothetical protein
MAQISYEDFCKQSMRDQVKHIDVTEAPSYPLWLKTKTAQLKRDAKEYNDTHSLDAFLASEKDLYTVGNSMTGFYATAKLKEYASAVVTELGIRYTTVSGQYRCFSANTEDLYRLLTDKG